MSIVTTVTVMAVTILCTKVQLFIELSKCIRVKICVKYVRSSAHDLLFGLLAVGFGTDS